MSDPSTPVGTTAGRDRGTAFKDGLKGIARAIWFVFSIVLYGLGMAFLTVGKALIGLSGWGKGDTDASAAPPTTPTTTTPSATPPTTTPPKR